MRDAKDHDFVFLVCGFGRCGSSLVMQMLDAGGYRVTGEHPAYEDEIVLAETQTPAMWLPYLGRAVKRIDPHVGSFPPNVPLRAIWLDRDHKEQAKSQAKFLKWSAGLHMSRGMRQALQRSYVRERPLALDALRRGGAGALTTLSFERLVTDPAASARIIRNAVSADLDLDAMEAVVIRRSVVCYPGMLEDRLLAEADRAA